VWRRSLQLRVVVTTLVVSGLVIALFASVLVSQIGRGVVDAKTRSALVEARSGLQLAQSRLITDEPISDLAFENRLIGVTQQLADRGSSGGLYEVLLLPPSEDAVAFASLNASLSDVPQELVDRLRESPGPAYVFSEISGPGGREPGLVVGAVLNVPALGDYRLVHLFPLDAERETLSLVRRTTAGAGLLLVALLGLITGLVVRQVVAPVQQAARTAEQLAAGRLDQRLRTRGEDEIARLGQSFNSMAESLQTQIRQLEDLSRVQRRFVSDVSHELRTPLTTVRMAADVLFDGREDFPPAVARSAELLQAELDRFEEMLVALLEISRYDAGAASLDAAPGDVGALVRRVVDAATPLAERRGTVLDLSGVPAAPVVAEIDPTRIERVLRNLVVNAVEHGEGRPVQVTVTGDPDAVTVLVRDHGVGLGPGQAGMVFTRFWRGDPSRARTTGGTGLGLAIALEDVRLHGGWLQAAGEPGRGTAFRMVLPRVAGRTPPDTPLRLEAAGRPGGPRDGAAGALGDAADAPAGSRAGAPAGDAAGAPAGDAAGAPAGDAADLPAGDAAELPDAPPAAAASGPGGRAR
jgi:two-component system, OmpR family, sensor histidine kinase MtrB